MAKISKETKQRLQQLFQCGQFAIRWGFIPTVLYLGFKRGADPGMPEPSVLGGGVRCSVWPRTEFYCRDILSPLASEDSYKRTDLWPACGGKPPRRRENIQSGLLILWVTRYWTPSDYVRKADSTLDLTLQ